MSTPRYPAHACHFHAKLLETLILLLGYDKNLDIIGNDTYFNPIGSQVSQHMRCWHEIRVCAYSQSRENLCSPNTQSIDR